MASSAVYRPTFPIEELRALQSNLPHFSDLPSGDYREAVFKIYKLVLNHDAGLSAPSYKKSNASRSTIGALTEGYEDELNLVNITNKVQPTDAEFAAALNELPTQELSEEEIAMFSGIKQS